MAGREPHPRIAGFFEPEEPFDRAADLSREQHEVDRRLIELGTPAALPDLQAPHPAQTPR